MIRTIGRAIADRLPSLRTESLLPELAAIGCFLILPWIGIVAALHHEYYAARAAAVRSTGNLAQALEESTRRTIGQIDYILLSARAFRTAKSDRFDFHDWARNQTFADKMTAQISMTDPAGLVIASTIQLVPGVNIADRAHFQAQLDPTHDDLYISRPVTGRVSGLQTIQFSRKLLDRDGAFAGVVVFSLGSFELARFYESLGLGDGFVSILSSDGTILAHGPWIPGLTGTNIRDQSGFDDMLNHSIGSIALGGTPRRAAQIASFRRLQDYPLVVMVGFDTNTVFGSYRALRANALLSGAAITLVVGLIGLLWLRQKCRSLLSRRALNVTLDTISQGILMVDARGGISVINPPVLDLLALPNELPEAALKYVVARATELIPAAGGDPAVCGMSGPGSGSARDGRLETALENGTIIDVCTHVLPEGGFVQTYTDVTEQRMAHAQVEHLAHHDGLTGLANRVELRQRISEIVGADRSEGTFDALIMIDLDGFKGVNDTLGHDAGDQVLIEVSRRIKSLVRATDVAARFGGDEFAILATGLRQCEDVVPLVERILRRLGDPVQMKSQQVRVGASLGIAFHPQDGQDIDTLFKHADIALYSAKAAGRGTYRCFDQQLTLAMTERRALESDLRRALDGDALEVYFQPKFSSKSLQIVGFEALARWRHPTRGWICPGVFIRIAEDCGLINRLGQKILERACQGVATWEPRLPVAVNVSVMQLHDDGLKDHIAAVLEQTGLQPEHLEIEVTESVLADDSQTVLGNLQAIKAMGIPITLDDFGTGYSSLSYLRRFPFDKIKIDKSFVQGQTEDPGVRVILEAILGMCHNLGLHTVGEGVETEGQREMLRAGGCSELQGYLLGRPMPGNHVQDFIRAGGYLPDIAGAPAEERQAAQAMSL
ncbi:MAG TPA: EAL domain-containing protein [Rhodopila sp.]